MTFSICEIQKKNIPLIFSATYHHRKDSHKSYMIQENCAFEEAREHLIEITMGQK